MLHLAQDAKWQVTVTAMDLQLAEERKSKGCPYCGGKLHSARFPRLLRGESGDAPISVHRHSFCCEMLSDNYLVRRPAKVVDVEQ